ncbi:MAG: NADH-flavin reductase, partial [Kribbellaceae bacterium]|nr:NADH-flavin reductase [Kribbellaceae bacterium]
GTVADDPALFPAALRPFAETHARQLTALEATALDWLVLAPPAAFGSGATTGHRLVTEPVRRAETLLALSHQEYATAAATELVTPTMHRRRAVVLPVG